MALTQVNAQVRAIKADESACTPGTVRSPPASITLLGPQISAPSTTSHHEPVVGDDPLPVEGPEPDPYGIRLRAVLVPQGCPVAAVAGTRVEAIHP